MPQVNLKTICLQALPRVPRALAWDTELLGTFQDLSSPYHISYEEPSARSGVISVPLAPYPLAAGWGSRFPQIQGLPPSQTLTVSLPLLQLPFPEEHDGKMERSLGVRKPWVRMSGLSGKPLNPLSFHFHAWKIPFTLCKRQVHEELVRR